MSDAAEMLLSRLDHPRPNGKDRWRCACPVCGERNRSTLSIGIGDSGAVLVKCWKNGCSPAEIAAAVGLEIEDLFPPRDSSAGPLRRRRMLTAQQALDLLYEEATLIWVVASDIARGKPVDEQTKDRLVTAAGRIGALRQEAYA